MLNAGGPIAPRAEPAPRCPDCNSLQYQWHSSGYACSSRWVKYVRSSGAEFTFYHACYVTPRPARVLLHTERC